MPRRAAQLANTLGSIFPAIAETRRSPGKAQIFDALVHQ
jgi:hypothetical protein